MSNPMLDERALIGALLHLPLSTATEVRAEFDREDLDDARLRIVVDLIDDCIGRNLRPDAAVVLAAGRTSALVPPSRLGELGYLLICLVEEVPHPSAGSFYALAVVEASVRRRIAEAATRLEQASSAELTAALAVVADECAALVDCASRILKGAKL